ncbi:MAG: pilus assembly protein [Rhodanobacter sp.]|nr:pilus assembly protein [Rhodanobacter sp.]
MHLYRITARSKGGNDSALRVIESTFAVKSN